MSIKNPEQLKEAINLAIQGNIEILYDIANYIAYNYYMYMHIKKDSPEDIENEKIYKDFQENYPETFWEVEKLINDIYEKYD